MAGMNDLPHEVLSLILRLLISASPLRYTVRLRAVSRTFCRIIDPLVLKQESFFTHPIVDHRNESVSSTHQHLYDRRGIFNLDIASKLIESRWDDRTIIHSRFKEFLELVEIKIQEHDVTGVEDPITFRKRICSWLARVTRIHINSRHWRQRVYEYTNLLVMRLAKLRRSKKDISRDFHGRKRNCENEGQEAFALAIVMCDPQTLKSFIASGISFIFDYRYFLTGMLETVHATPSYQRDQCYRGSPIEIAAMCGLIDHLRLLLEQLSKAADLIELQEHLSSSLQLASEYGHFDVIKQLKVFVTQHNILNVDNCCAMFDAFERACANDHLAIAEEFQCVAKHDVGRVLGLCIAKGCKSSIIRYLVTCGAQLNHPLRTTLDSSMHTALMMAIRYGHKHLVRTLIELGSKPNQKNLWRGCFWPIYWDDLEMLSLLVSVKVKVYHNEKLYSPDDQDHAWNEDFTYVAGLPLASTRRSFKAAKFLVKNYPQVLKTKQPGLAVANTSSHGDLAMTNFLFASGADVSRGKGARAVFMATAAGNLSLLKLLLERGASTDICYWYELPREQQSPPHSIFRKMSSLAVAISESENENSLPHIKENFSNIVEFLLLNGAKSKIGEFRSADHILANTINPTQWV